MISDQISYLSGWIPLGIWLPILLGMSFTFIWWTIWAGTGFWSIRRFWKVLSYGWVITITLYTAAWFIERPPPIPVRVIITIEQYEKGETPWFLKGVQEAIAWRLRTSPRSYVVLDGDYCPALNRARFDERSFERLARWMKAKWLLKISRGGAPVGNPVKIEMYKRSGSRFKRKFLIENKTEPFSAKGEQIAEIVAIELGDDLVKAKWVDHPSDMPDTDLRKFYDALILRDDGHIDSAEVILDRLKQSNPSWIAAHRESARCQLKSHPGIHHEEINNSLYTALKLSRNTSRLSNQDSESLILFAYYYLESRDWDLAESALKLAYNSLPDDPRVLFYLSRLSKNRLQEMHLKSSHELQERALYLAPGYVAARLALTEYYSKRLEKNPAMSILDEGLGVDPNSLPLLLSRSALQLEMSRTEEALQTCQQILDMKPRHPGALYNMGIGSIYLERFEDGIAFLDSSYRNGGTVDNLYYKGVAYQRMGRYPEAIKEFQHRFAEPRSSDDRIALSSRQRIKRLKKWIAEADSGKG